MLLTSRQISHVRQREQYDCAIACLSMVTSLNMDYIKNDIKRDGYDLPLGLEPIIRFLTRHQIFTDKVGGAISPNLQPNSVYIATTSSTVRAGGFHLVVAVSYEDSVRIFDPNDDFAEEALYGSAPNIISCFDYFLLTDCSIK